MLDVAAQDTATLISDSFEQSKAPNDSPWKALSPETIANRRGGGDSHR